MLAELLMAELPHPQATPWSTPPAPGLLRSSWWAGLAEGLKTKQGPCTQSTPGLASMGACLGRNSSGNWGRKPCPETLEGTPGLQIFILAGGLGPFPLLCLLPPCSFPPFLAEMVQESCICWGSSARGLHSLFVYLFFPLFPPHPGLPTGWHGRAISLS